MDFELWWLLVIIPTVFALGWGASRFDLHQWRREQMDAPRAYFKGLHFLLNEQQDKAIDAFIEAVQYDADTADLHFALGNLFRKRGEYERAVRVHQHLLARADLPASERDRAQYALAQDYLKAGLMDHAEKSLLALKDVAIYKTDVYESLLALYEKAHDWSLAIETIDVLEQEGVDNLNSRKAHYHCELAAEAQRKGNAELALSELKQARHVSVTSARPLAELIFHHVRHGNMTKSFEMCEELLSVAPRFVVLVIPMLADAIEKIKTAADSQAKTNTHEELREKVFSILEKAHEQDSSLDLLLTFLKLDHDVVRCHERILEYLRDHSSIIASAALLKNADVQEKGIAVQEELELLQKTLESTAKRLDRYRCSSCGFEAVRYFWQCPGCQSWDSYPPKKVEELQ